MLQSPDLRPDAPWKIRFRAPAIDWAVLATGNPERGLVCTNRDGIFQLYAWDVGSNSLTRLTDQPAGVISGAISADGRHVYYLKDAGGNEIGHFVRIPFDGGTPQDITPDLPPYAAFVINQCRSGRLTGFQCAGPEGFQTFVVPEGRPPVRVFHSERIAFGPVLSFDGEIAVVQSTERSGSLDGNLVAIDTSTGATLSDLWDGEGTSMTAGPFSPLPGDFRMLASTSRSGNDRPLIWNPRTGERLDLPLDDIPGELTPWGWSPDARRIILCQLHRAQYQLYLYDLASGSVTRLAHPAGVLGVFGPGYFTPEGDLFVTWQDSVQPARLIALDGATGEQKRVVLSAGEVPAGRKWRSFTFSGANGDAIQGWLVTPEGEGPFPTILHTHGGPTWAQIEMFDAESQAWVDHGYAFCTINYHGSTTFGKPFEKSLWHNMGNLEIEDMAAAHGWLVANRVAKPGSILLTGDSYGGYLTLQGMGKRPDLWAGGMAGVAIADWGLMYEDQAETLRGYQRALFGGTPEETPDLTRSASPITYAEQVRAPILVIQGSNDTRCPARQMRAYEEKLKSLGKSIHVHWFEAGHGSRAAEQQIEHQELKLRFAHRLLR